MPNIINKKHQPIRGFRYLSSRESTIYQFIQCLYFQVAVEHFNMKIIVPPLLAPAHLFTSLGQNSDIVRKELYSFIQKDGEEVALVPELTRVIVEQLAHEKIYSGSYVCFGQCFRYERPQKGRYRSFTQGSVELFGTKSYMKDIELFLFIKQFFHKLYIDDAVLHLNFIGTLEDRARYIEALKTYFTNLILWNKLSNNSKEKFERGAFLRMLDSKNEDDLVYIKEAPRIYDYLSIESQNRYNTIKRLLDSANITYVENPFLVRGLDYYNDIVFEYTHHLLGAQSSLCGGGRYDGLFKEVAKVDVPAVGAGFGIDRIMLVLEEKMSTNPLLELECFGASTIVNIIPIEETDKEYVMKIGEEFRKQLPQYGSYHRSKKINILWEGKVSHRMKKSAEEASYVIIVGETERKENILKVKDMNRGITLKLEREKILNFEEYFTRYNV